MATITDVAKRAGVSRSTVSRVLNNHAYIGEETRARVLEAIRELNYQPNSLARSLVRQRTGNILVVVQDSLDDAFYSILSNFLLQHAYARGYNLLFYFRRYNNGQPLDFLDSFYGNVDGIVFLSAFRILSRESLLRLKRLNVPMVLIHSEFGVPGVAEVNVDNYAGSYLATEKLIRMGHKRIAYGAAMIDTNFEMRARLDAYRQAMSDNGLSVPPEWVVKVSNPNYSLGYEIAPILWAQQPTALLCTNDIMALGVCRWMGERGIRIPEHLSIVGFDDILSQGESEENMIERRLTTMRQPLNEMAEHAIDTVHRLIDKIETPLSRVFPVAWIDQGTAAAPREATTTIGGG